MNKIMSTVAAASCAGLLALSAFGQVVINEIQSSNDSTYVDSTGQSPDWIELRNTSSVESVDISGWGLSDKPKKPFKWTFPEGTTLEPGAFLLVFADGRVDLADGLHAASSLSSSGEDLLLTAADGTEKGTLVDQVTFGRIPCDTSYGRAANGDFVYFATPTPGAPNADETYAAPLEAVQFSVGRGVFDAPFEVALTNADPEAEIYYTLDHSDPAATNGVRYTSPIAVAGTTIVRATAVKAGTLPYRNITTHSYIFPTQVMEQKKPACAGDVWNDTYKCNASYTVSTNVVKDAATLRQFTDALAVAPIVSVTLDDDQMFNPTYGLHSKPWLAQNENPTYKVGKVVYPFVKERVASVEWVTGTDSNRVFGLDAGLKIQGGWGRKFSCTPKKSFQFKFRGKYGASSLDKPVLADSGCPRDSFESLILRAEYHDSWAECSAAGIRGNHMKDEFFRELQAPINGYCLYGDYVHLFINGLYWGLYNICEHADEHSAAAIGGGEAEEYTVVKSKSEVVNGEGADFKEFATNVWNAVYDYYCEKPRDNKYPLSYEVSFVARGLDMRKRENYAKAEAFTDMDNFIGYMCLGYYAGNTDWPENNWVAFDRPTDDVPFRWFAWDFETTLQSVDVNVVAVANMDHNNAFIGNPGHLEKALEFSPEFRQRFADRFSELTGDGGVLSVDSLTNRYAKLGAKVRPMLFAEAARWGAYWNEYAMTDADRYAVRGLPDWDREYARQMNEIIPNRCANVITQLVACALLPTNALPPKALLSADGKALTLACPNADGQVWYTLDGSNPCDPWTGAPSASALAAAGETLTAASNVVVNARVRTADGEWSALTAAQLQGSLIERNRFLSTDTGDNWDKDANWSFGSYPDAPDAYALIGTPTAAKEGKGWRNVDVNKHDVTVGHVEFENGGWTNRIDTGNFGNFTFYAGEGTNATVEVLDPATPGLAMFDLDEPNRLVLGSALELIAASEGGDAQWGSIYLKGALDGNGKDLVKRGAGRVTVGCTNAAESVSVGSVEIAEGELAITKGLSVGAVGGAGRLLVPVFGTNETDAVALSASAAGDATPASVCLFVPYSTNGVYFGGMVAGGALADADACCVYALSADGTVQFKNDWYAPAEVVRVERYQLEDGRQTYRVTLGEEVPGLTSVEMPTAATELVYTGVEQTGVASAEGYEVTGGTATDAGDYVATATLAEGCQWTDGTTAAKEVAWTIAPKALTADMVGDIADQAYTGAALEPAVTVADEPPCAVTDADYAVAYADNVNAGTATATVTGRGNYAGTVEKPFAILRADYDMSAAAWDETASFVYDGTEKSVSLTGLPSGVTATYAEAAATNAGAYTAHATLAYDADNYNAPAVADLDWTIAPRPATVASGSATKAYDGAPLTCGAVTQEGFVAGEGVDCEVTGSQTDVGTSANAFTYAFAEGTKASNYTVTKTEGALTVTLGGIVFEADDVAAAYDGTGHGIAVAVETPAEGAVVTYAAAEDGAYAAEPVLFTNATETAQAVWFRIEAENYLPTNGVAYVTVAPKALTADMVGDIADQAYTGAALEPAVTVADEPPCAVTDADYAVAYADNVNAGTATATVTGRGNYTGSVQVPFTILPDATTVSVGTAVGAPELDWTASGDAPWTGVLTAELSCDGESAARSGVLGRGQQSVLTVTLEGAGTLSFDWRADGAEYDALWLQVDGKYVRQISGGTAWTNAAVPVENGTHVVSWIYRRSRSGGPEEGTAWLDNVVWTSAAQPTLAEALNGTLEWTTGGDAAWEAYRSGASYEGGICAVSGPVGDGESSYVETRVTGAGRLDFVWAVSCEDGYDWFAFYLDGALVGALTGEQDWTPEKYVLGEGEHVLRWEYWKDEYDEPDATGADCALLDYVRWTPKGGATDPDLSTEQLSEFCRWLKEHRQLDEASGETEALSLKTCSAAGKTATLFNEFVTGTDPEDETSEFRAMVDIVDGKPVVTWDPALNGEGVKEGVRTYRTLGAKTLDGAWTEVPEGCESDYNFFKVEVALP